MPEFSNLCRICLKEGADMEEMQPLFDESNDRCMEIVQQIEECGGIVLKPHEDFPKLICQQCLQYLDTSYKFRAMCQASEHALLDVIIKTELQIPSVDGNSQTPTHSEYIELRGEYIEAEEIDIVEADQIDGDSAGIDEFCERYSPMPTENDEEEEDEEEEQEGEDVLEEFIDNDETAHDDPEFEYESPKKNKLRRKAGRPIKKSTKSPPQVDGVKRKRGRPRLAVMSFPELKHVKKEDTESEDMPAPKLMKPSNRGRKRNEDIPTTIMCEICGNIYSKPALLHVHMRRHMEEKPYECEICNKRFAGNSEVRRHMRVHTGEKPYVCRFCGRTFADRSTNIKHERIHTNERPFTCNQCGKSFTYSNVLKNHMLIHTGEKPFPCLPCNKTFSRKHQLEQHCLTLTHQNTIKNVYKEELIDSSDERLLKVC